MPCENIKSPQACNIWRSRPKDARWHEGSRVMWLSFAGSLSSYCPGSMTWIVPIWYGHARLWPSLSRWFFITIRRSHATLPDMECINFVLVLHLFHSQMLCIVVVCTLGAGIPDSWCDDFIGSNLDCLTIVRTVSRTLNSGMYVKEAKPSLKSIHVAHIPNFRSLASYRGMRELDVCLSLWPVLNCAIVLFLFFWEQGLYLDLHFHLCWV